MATLDPEQLRLAVLGVVLLVAGFDLGIAFLIRGQRTAAGDE